jgi:hypothetical protein
VDLRRGNRQSARKKRENHPEKLFGAVVAESQSSLLGRDERAERVGGLVGMTGYSLERSGEWQTQQCRGVGWISPMCQDKSPHRGFFEPSNVHGSANLSCGILRGDFRDSDLYVQQQLDFEIRQRGASRNCGHSGEERVGNEMWTVPELRVGRCATSLTDSGPSDLFRHLQRCWTTPGRIYVKPASGERFQRAIEG